MGVDFGIVMIISPFVITQVEPLSAVVEEQVSVAPPQETLVQQETDMKEDEDPMEQEESNQVIQEQSDTVSQVRLLICFIL